MTIDDTEIEKRIVAYIRSVPLPTRHNAIREVTGQVEILPSAVAKVITKMIDGGTMRHLKATDRLELIE